MSKHTIELLHELISTW